MKRGVLMNEYILSCSSTVDLTEKHLNDRDIKWVKFHFTLGDKHYPDDLGKSIGYKEFYEIMENGADTKTSQATVEQFISFFSKYLDQGKDILHLTVSAALSGENNSANVAKSILEEKYPDRKIII